MIFALAITGFAAGAETEEDDFPDNGIPFERSLKLLDANARYAGDFSAAPVLHWMRPLPGPPLNSATHTERTRAVVVGDDLLIGSAAGKGLYRLSRRDGGLVTVYPAATSVESEPFVAGDRVYFGDTGGNTWCYTLDGELVWSHDSRAPILVRPTVHEGVLYITNVDDLALALDAESGELVWRYQARRDITREAELALYAAPPAVILENDVLLGFSDGSLVALERASGEEAWTKRVGEGRYPDLVAQPVQHGNDIFAAGYYQPLVAIDAATRNVRWRMDVGSASAVAIDTESKPVVLYQPGTDGKLRAIIALTGAEKWEWDSKTDGALTTPQLTPVGLLVGSSEGGLYLLDADSGEQTWKFHEDHILSGVTATPVIAGRQVLFVTNAGNLVSMLAPAAKTKWPAEDPGPLWKSQRFSR